MNGRETKKEKWNRLTIPTASLILFALFLVLVVPIFFLKLVRSQQEGHYPPAEITLSYFLCLSLIALLVALTFMVYIFKNLNLASPNNTLGLPEGSIRAVIALSLILIFMISSLFLYEQVSSGKPTESISLSQAEYDNISKELIYSSQAVPRNVPGNPTNETRYIVRLRTTENENSVDIAKQIITTVSTLVVAVAGFYFGSNAVAAASKAATGAGGEIPLVPKPFIRNIKPSFGVKGTKDFELEITGENLNSPEEVKLVRESDTESDIIRCEDVLSRDKKIQCKCKLEIPDKPENYPVGAWTVVVINSQYEEGRLPNGFTVKGEESDVTGKEEESGSTDIQ